MLYLTASRYVIQNTLDKTKNVAGKPVSYTHLDVYKRQRRRGTPISGPILKEKAIILHSKLQDAVTFSASDGWLSCWKKRHRVHFIGVCGEKLSADPSAASDFSKKLSDIIASKNLSPEQVYNIDETR